MGELAEFINGRAYKQDELLASGKYPVLRVGNFYTNDKWYYSNLELPEKYYAEEGDLLYTWSATFGPHIWIGPKVIYHYHIWKVALKNIFEKDFALQFFEADRVRLLNSTNGSTMIHVTKKDMESKGILLPDVYEQRTIGDLLKRVDHLIAATQHKIDAWEQAKKALLQRLFDQSWRFKGYSDPWEKRKLGETNSYFTDGNYGESYPKESELSDKENGVPFLRGSNLRNGELIEDNANYITKEKHAELTSGHLVEDDIVLAVRGSLGALGYVKDENIDWNINSQLAVIRTDKSELSGKFLVQFLLSWRGQKELLSRNTGTALKQLPIKQLKDVPVPIVNLDEQKEIGALFSSIDNLIAATQSRFSSLELLKKALLQDLFI
ncbi:restriction endonuclease subunit S [Lacticaseibacillus paracasei subsp. paracasei]|uniref:restriction endonuclease subunit S n=1 Tax=Lacticaseibacillus paracasei TaxID=1597 RepID=UPI0035589DFB